MSRGKELAQRAPAALAAAPPNPVSNELAAVLAKLPIGVYRSTVTICRIDIGPDGLEKGAQVVNQICRDFDVKPRKALAAPAAAPELAAADGKDGAP